MSKAPQQKVTKTSTCNCGRVKISVNGADKGAVLCHCDNCKRASGSAFGHNQRVANADFKILQGKDVLKTYYDGNTKSGTTLSRNFCSSCGSPMFLTTPAVKNLYILQAGCIDTESSQPFTEFFKDDKYSWLSDMAKPKL